MEKLGEQTERMVFGLFGILRTLLLALWSFLVKLSKLSNREMHPLMFCGLCVAVFFMLEIPDKNRYKHEGQLCVGYTQGWSNGKVIYRYQVKGDTTWYSDRMNPGLHMNIISHGGRYQVLYMTSRPHRDAPLLFYEPIRETRASVDTAKIINHYSLLKVLGVSSQTN